MLRTDVLRRLVPTSAVAALIGVDRAAAARASRLAGGSTRGATFPGSPCAPEPYVFQSTAGYEAVRVKDCRHDQQVYLPSSEAARIGRFVAECRLICSGQSGQGDGL